MAIENMSRVDGIGYDDNTSATPNPGIISGRKLKWFGQTVNKGTGNVTNQQVGTAVLTATTAGTVGTVTVTNSLVTSTTSVIFLTAVNEVGAGTFGGDATAGRGVDVWIESISAGSFVIGYNPRANMSADWSANYLIIN